MVVVMVLLMGMLWGSVGAVGVGDSLLGEDG